MLPIILEFLWGKKTLFKCFTPLGRLLSIAALGAATLLHAAVAQAGTEPLEVGSSLSLPSKEVVLEVHGNIANTNVDGAALLDMDMLRTLPPVSLETTTSVTDGVPRFDGFLMRDLLALLEAEGQTATATALNDYVIDIPIEDFERFDVVLAYRMDGDRLLPSDKGPLWIVYPRDQHAELQDIRYDYRWVWQLQRLDIQ